MSCESLQRILIADDDRISRNLLADFLKGDHTVILAKNGIQALERAKNSPSPDIILLDVLMDEMNGYKVLHHLKEDEQTKNIPVIFITGLDSLDDEEKGLEMGAVDYITKPFRPAIVKARVRNHLRYVRNQKLLEKEAHIDVLTELGNRRILNIVFQREWQRCLRNNRPFSLAVADVDCFKQYNDFYGHGAGDRVLQAIAAVLKSEVKRMSDFCGRYGGEEFVIMMPDTNRVGAKMLLDRIHSKIETLHIAHEKSSVVPWITISIGGMTVIPQADTSPFSLFDEADKLLYEAKRNGRNCVIWHEEMP
ncbi:MAG: diguanylate cyclase [Crocosphaera sp.]